MYKSLEQKRVKTGTLKMADMKLHDMKMVDYVAGHELRHEIVRPNCRHEIARHENVEPCCRA
jgi:hypothetical protein